MGHGLSREKAKSKILKIASLTKKTFTRSANESETILAGATRGLSTLDAGGKGRKR